MQASLNTWNGWTQNPSGIYVPQKQKCKRPRRLQAVDLFAGCGGFSLGVEASGIDVVAAVEWWEVAATTYLANLGHRNGCVVGYVDDDVDRERFEKELARAGKRSGNKALWSSGRWVGMHRSPDCDMGCRAFLFGDAAKATGDYILDMLRAAPGGWHESDKVDLVIGGPPCQGMSKASGRAKPTDPRNNLILEYLRLVSELDAQMFVMENVPPLLEGGKFRDLRDAYFARAGELGYDLAANIINAANYNVPQTRRRAIIVGHKKGTDPYSFPMPHTWSMRVEDGQLVTDMLTRDRPNKNDDDNESTTEVEPGEASPAADQMEMF